MVNVKLLINAKATNDGYARVHGLAIDTPLERTFWTTQPGTKIGTTGNSFRYEKEFDLAIGNHTIEYGNSGYVPDYAWHVTISVDGNVVAEGSVGRNSHLIANISVVGEPITPTIPPLMPTPTPEPTPTPTVPTPIPTPTEPTPTPTPAEPTPTPTPETPSIFPIIPGLSDIIPPPALPPLPLPGILPDILPKIPDPEETEAKQKLPDIPR